MISRTYGMHRSGGLCNRVDNTHPDTLARPFTFAPLQVAAGLLSSSVHMPRVIAMWQPKLSCWTLNTLGLQSSSQIFDTFPQSSSKNDQQSVLSPTSSGSILNKLCCLQVGLNHSLDLQSRMSSFWMVHSQHLL